MQSQWSKWQESAWGKAQVLGTVLLWWVSNGRSRFSRKRWLGSQPKFIRLPTHWNPNELRLTSSFADFLIGVGSALLLAGAVLFVFFSGVPAGWYILKALVVGNLFGANVVAVFSIVVTFNHFGFSLKREAECESRIVDSSVSPEPQRGALAMWEKSYYRATFSDSEYAQLDLLPGDMVRELYGQAQWLPTKANLDWAQELFAESACQQVEWLKALKNGSPSRRFNSEGFIMFSWIYQEWKSEWKKEEYASLSFMVPYLLKRVNLEFNVPQAEGYGFFLEDSINISGSGAERNQAALLVAAASLAGANFFDPAFTDIPGVPQQELARNELEFTVLTQLKSIENAMECPGKVKG